MFTAPPPPPGGGPAYAIFGSDMQVVQLFLKEREKAEGQPDAFLYSSTLVATETRYRGGFFATIQRMMCGENGQVGVYTNMDTNMGYIAFSQQCSGRIIPIDLRTKGAVYTFALNYLCSVGVVEYQVAPSEARRYFAPELLLQKMSGQGVVFLQACGGTVVEKPLVANESLVVTRRTLLAMSATCKVSWSPTAFIPGSYETVVVTGPGVVYMQSNPLSGLVRKVGWWQSRSMMSLAPFRLIFPMFGLVTVLFLVLVLVSAIHAEMEL